MYVVLATFCCALACEALKDDLWKCLWEHDDDDDDEEDENEDEYGNVDGDRGSDSDDDGLL